MPLNFTKPDILTVFVVSLAKFLVGFITSVVIPVFPSLLERNFSLNSTTSSWSIRNGSSSFDYTKLSILYGTKNIGQIVMSPILGHFVDVVGYHYILLFGSINQCGCTLIYGFGRSYAVLIVGRLVESVSSAAIHTGVAALVAYKYSNHQQRGFVFGLSTLALYIGSALGPPFGGWCYEYHSQLMTFLAVSIVTVLALLATLAAIHVDKSWCSCVPSPTRLEIIGTSERKRVKISYSRRARNSSFTDNFIEDDGPYQFKGDKESTIYRSVDSLHSLKFQQDKESPLKKTELMLSEEEGPIVVIHSQNFMAFLRDRHFLICLGMFPNVIVTLFVYFAALPRYMHSQFGSTETQQGLVWLMSLIGYAVGFWLGNFVNSRLIHFRHIALLFLGYTHAAGLMCAALVPVWWGLALPLGVIVCVHLASETIIAPLLVAIVERNHARKFGTMSGYLMLTIALTSTLGSILGPILLNAVGFIYLNLIIFMLNVIYSPLYMQLSWYM